jgi:hypothetical protein
MSAQQWAANRGESPSSKSSATQSGPVATKPPDVPKAPEKPQEERPKGQVVDVAEGNGETSPDAKYLAESSNRVDKETRAKEQTAFYKNAMPQRTAPKTETGGGSQDRLQLGGNNGRGLDDRPLRETAGGQHKGAMEIPDVQKREEIALRDRALEGPGARVANRTGTEAVRGNSDRLRIQPGPTAGGDEEASEGRVGTPGLSTLIPSSAIVDKVVGAAPNDHLSDVDEGNGTFLNTRNGSTRASSTG